MNKCCNFCNYSSYMHVSYSRLSASWEKVKIISRHKCNLSSYKGVFTIMNTVLNLNLNHFKYYQVILIFLFCYFFIFLFLKTLPNFFCPNKFVRSYTSVLKWIYCCIWRIVWCDNLKTGNLRNLFYQTFRNHRITAERGGQSNCNSSLPLLPASEILRHQPDD